MLCQVCAYAETYLEMRVENGFRVRVVLEGGLIECLVFLIRNGLGITVIR